MMPKLLVCLAVIAACAYAQVSQSPKIKERYPDTYKFIKRARHTRDLSKTWDTQVGDGTLFGTLGEGDQGLYGKAGYKGVIFDDNRGKLRGEAYGTRVLGANGDSTQYGGKLKWSKENVRASVNLNKEVGGMTSLGAEASKVWKLDKDTYLSAGGALSQKDIHHGKPDVGIVANIERKF